MYPTHLVSKMLMDIEAANHLEDRINTLNGGVWTDQDRETIATLHKNVVEIRETLSAIRLRSIDDNLGHGAFQTVELFPPMPISGAPTSDCTECGAYVKMLQQHKHTAWHNKVADL